MPSLYAHKKFGAEVYRLLPVELKKIIAAHRDEYLIGLHGPDILFFNLTDNDRVTDLGKKNHKYPFAVMEKRAFRLIMDSSDEAELSYFFGCICHFVLDAAVHPLVDEAIQATGMSHGKIETELDRYALLSDGHDALTYPAHAHLPVSVKTAEIASRFYKDLSPADFHFGMVCMKALYVGTSKRNPVIRNTMIKIMDKAGFGSKVASFFMSKDRSQLAARYVAKMYELMGEEVARAVELIDDFYASILTGKLSLSPYLRKNYYGK
ncbi:MAG: zinc dependent phospholipase C family protein [Lachnospiraceae bacterium]|nr:zinc dependent phospholipase C family protein [Lachnospiraceae bacterium]